MGWVDSLQGIVAIDTAPVIAFIAQEPTHIELVRPLFQSIAQGRIQAVTSMLTLAEVLVRPLREGNTALAARYENISFTRTT